MAKRLLVGLCLAIGLTACGSESDNKKKDTSTSPTKTWTDIKTIVSQSCIGSTCHTGTADSRDFRNITETDFKSSAAKSRIQTNAMPPPNNTENRTLSAADRQVLLDFL